MTFTPASSDQEVPVRLEAHRLDGVILAIDYAISKCLRQGRKEVELQIGEGQFAGHFNIVFQTSGSVQVSLTLQLDSLSPDKVLRTIEFVESLQQGADLAVVPLVDSPLNIRGQCVGVGFPDLTAPKARLEWLNSINTTYGTSLKHWPNIDEETWELIWLYAEGTKMRTVKYRNKGSTTLYLEREMGLRLLETLLEGSDPLENLAISLDSPQVELLGEVINLPVLVSIYEKPSLDENPDNLRARLAQLDDEGMAPFQINCEALYVSFEPQKLEHFD